MYKIDRNSNRISKINKVNFTDLGFTERSHLQEWIANKPEVFGEDLLIIQKEFNGFDDTKERLDLLAIDKMGSLVIIENKLDDSGKDVVWQALKYASYCSTLSKSQIAEIFQKFLDKSNIALNAQSVICEFLEQEDFSEVVLNPGNDQRLIMVAAHFRKEVTSTVLWLLKHRVFVKCFRATPFKDESNLFLTIEQVIPLPEAEELMIGISEKEVEEQSSELGQASRHQLRTEFWHSALAALKKSNIELYTNVNPGRDHWLNAGSGASGINYSMIFTRNEVRVDFALNTRTQDVNKILFDHLFKKKDEIEKKFGENLIWRRMDENKVSLIQCSKTFDGYNRTNWDDMIAWLVSHVKKMEDVFDSEVPTLRQLSKTALTLESISE